MNAKLEEMAPVAMQGMINALRKLCGLKLVIGVQVLFADGKLSICAHNLDKDGLVSLLEGALANIRSGEHVRQHAVDGEVIAVSEGRPN